MCYKNVNNPINIHICVYNRFLYGFSDVLNCMNIDRNNFLKTIYNLVKVLVLLHPLSCDFFIGTKRGKVQENKTATLLAERRKHLLNHYQELTSYSMDDCY